MSQRYPGGLITKTPVTPSGPTGTNTAPGVWTIEQALEYQKAGNWPSSAGTIDTNFEYVTLLLPGNGTNGAQNNTFLDSSTNNFTITRNGNTTQGTFSPYGDNWSNYFTGASGTYLSFANNSALNIGSGNFTAEAWIFPTTRNNNTIFYKGPVTGPSYDYFLGWDGTALTVIYGGSTLATMTDTTTLNAWNHVALVRNTSNNTLRVYINGVQAYSATYTGTFASSSGGGIGGTPGLTNTYAFNGYISNVRFTQSAVYTADFTPPTAPLTAITNTSLLTCQSNRFIDNSTNAFTITRNGNTSVQRFSPFSPTASYASGTIGGSGYFDGSGDYLGIPDSTDFDLNSTFTIDLWYYQPSAGDGAFLGRGGGDGSWSQTNGHEYTFFVLSGSIYWQWNVGNPTIPASITGTAPPVGQWNHIAIGYNGTTTRMWVNGSSIGSSTTGYTLPTTRNITRVGQIASGEVPYNGFIGQLRIVKGTDVYGVSNTSITVPTLPLTALTNTKLLLNFTNAGIIDNAMMNDLETVGNAQISTTQSKFGGSSIAFDGSGDYLVMPSSQNFAFGTGDFTVEYWINTTSAQDDGILQISTTAGGFATSYTNGLMMSVVSGTLYYALGGSSQNTSTTINDGVWHHIAMCRSGSSLKVFVDGSSVVSTTNTNSVTGTNLVVGGYYSTAYTLSGYIDDLRITKGVARYTANFTAPTAAFPTR